MVSPTMDLNLGIFIVMSTILGIAILTTLLNHRKKIKSNQKVCVACRGIGFQMSLYRDRPAPSCKSCNGTGYVLKDKDKK
ncbi:MAG: hypothetical protein ACR2LL_07110 [Nitrosopumilus sp.]